jgi:hypothetical protein
MSYFLALVIENGAFLAIFLVCMLTAYTIYKRGQGLPGSELATVGFALYGMYGLLAFTGPGFTGSFFRDFSKVGSLNSMTYLYFITFALRAGMILIIAGIYRMARSARRSET